jgi:hypothetical protein
MPPPVEVIIYQETCNKLFTDCIKYTLASLKKKAQHAYNILLDICDTVNTHQYSAVTINDNEFTYEMV